MSFFVSKTNYLIFNRRAVSWAGSLDHTGIQWRAVQVCADDIVSRLICVGKPAGFLFDLHVFRICGKGKWHYSLIPKLLLHFAVINGISCNSRRCSGFKTEHFNSQFFQRIGQIIGCLQTVWTCIIADITINTTCFQIGSGTQNNRLTMVNSSGISLYTSDSAILYKKLCYLTLTDSQVLLILQSLSHLVTVCLLVSLCAKGVNSRALGAIQHL